MESNPKQGVTHTNATVFLSPVVVFAIRRLNMLLPERFPFGYLVTWCLLRDI